MIIVVCHRAVAVAEGLAATLRVRLGPDVAAVEPTDLDAVWEEWSHADLAVVDARLAPASPGDLCARLVAAGIKPVMIVDPEATSHLRLLEHGATGIAVTTDGLAGVLDAVRTVLAGHTHLPAHLLGSVLHELIVERRVAEQPSDRIASLSPREWQVLSMLGAGAGTREIAARLVISPHTAKTHINRLLGKLGLSSRSEAAAFALDHDIRPSLQEASGD